jgi:hypothetical protein
MPRTHQPAKSLKRAAESAGPIQEIAGMAGAARRGIHGLVDHHESGRPVLARHVGNEHAAVRDARRVGKALADNVEGIEAQGVVG